jgi:hypothetical protein
MNNKFMRTLYLVVINVITMHYQLIVLLAGLIYAKFGIGMTFREAVDYNMGYVKRTVYNCNHWRIHGTWK